jgi:hypothetical protein
MDGYFVLNERGEPRLEPDLEAWSRWFERADRSVARTVVSAGITVLTTFRGVGETNDSGEAPPLFETRVFGGILDGEERWSRTRAEAVAGHEWLAAWCRVGNAHNHGITEAQLR